MAVVLMNHIHDTLHQGLPLGLRMSRLILPGWTCSHGSGQKHGSSVFEHQCKKEIGNCNTGTCNAAGLELLTN